MGIWSPTYRRDHRIISLLVGIQLHNTEESAASVSGLLQSYTDKLPCAPIAKGLEGAVL